MQISNVSTNSDKSSVFKTVYSQFTDFFWKHRSIAFPLVGVLAIATIVTLCFRRNLFKFSTPAVKTPKPPRVYNPTTTASIAQVYPEGSLLQSVEARDVVLLQRILQNTNPNHDPLSLRFLQDKALLPTQKLQIDNITYYCSTPFILGGIPEIPNSGRLAVLVLCVIEGKAYPRMFYLSQSQALLRVLPEVVKVDLRGDGNRLLGQFGKGKSEIDTILPIELNVALSLAYLQKESLFPKLEDKIPIPNIVCTAPGSGMLPAYCTREYSEMIQAIETSLDKSQEKMCFSEIPPETSPDFARPLKEFSFWSPLYGDMRGYVYPSINNAYRYLFCEVINPDTSNVNKNTHESWKSGAPFDSLKGKAFLAARELVHENPLTIFGNREFYDPAKNIDLPLLEYHKQIPGGFTAVRGSPSLKDYICAWNVIRQNTLVQEWYKAQNKELPPEYGS